MSGLRDYGLLAYRLTQMLTEHGRFRRYLFLKVRKRHHCEDCLEESVEHKVVVCPAWAEHHRVIRGIGVLSSSSAKQSPATINAARRVEKSLDDFP